MHQTNWILQICVFISAPVLQCIPCTTFFSFHLNFYLTYCPLLHHQANLAVYIYWVFVRGYAGILRCLHFCERYAAKFANETISSNMFYYWCFFSSALLFSLICIDCCKNITICHRRTWPPPPPPWSDNKRCNERFLFIRIVGINFISAIQARSRNNRFVFF